MNIDNIQNSLMNKIISRAKAIVEKNAKTLASMIRYETTVANTELSMQSEDHGYDFKFIPDSFAEGIVFGCVIENGTSVKMSMTIPSSVFKNATDGQISFFKEYIIENAKKRLNSML